MCLDSVAIAPPCQRACAPRLNKPDRRAATPLRTQPSLSCQRSGGVLVVKRGGVGDADDQAVLGEEPGHRLPPRLGTRRMQQLVALALKFAASRGDGFCVLDLELD